MKLQDSVIAITSASNREQIIWQVVCAIPAGSVASYGQVAKMAGLDGLARFVGRTLSHLPEGSDVPWHRILRNDGRFAFAENSERFALQTVRLRAEGIEVRRGRVAMGRYRWSP
jgi:methylated-DNA-protein-cysteine methyltransferase-like protein